jgi:hypothetical protein
MWCTPQVIMKRGHLIALAIVVVVVLLIVLGVWRNNELDKSLKNWDTIKTYIEGDLKGDLKKLHSLSDEEYMQCAVGVWILANIPEEDVKKLLNIKTKFTNEEELKNGIRSNQAFMRKCFTRRVKQNKYYWECEFMMDLINRLKKVPLLIDINETEKIVADSFCEKHKSGETVFKTKIFGGKMTIIENAINKFLGAFTK